VKSPKVRIFADELACGRRELVGALSGRLTELEETRTLLVALKIGGPARNVAWLESRIEKLKTSLRAEASAN